MRVQPPPPALTATIFACLIYTIMANRTVTQLSPVSSDLQTLNIVYENGTAKTVNIVLDVRLSGSDQSLERKFLQVNVSSLSVQRQNNLNDLGAMALTGAINTFGF